MEYQLENVNVIYDRKKDAQTFALKDVNLSLEGNKLIGILGPSGSGKSSLLYSMAGLRQPTSGQVFYNHVDFAGMNPSALAALRRREFGFIFQRHFLINYMTVTENILVPLNLNSKPTRSKAMSMLERLGIAHLAGKKPYQLSGGQRQRAAIIRALINDPKVIFGDEPTAALDHKSAREVMSLLTEYTKNAMVIIVTHDESILKDADTIIRIWDGTIAEVRTREQEGKK
jgi:ABC-type antimicrobial peptide transport system, ATPase component